MWGPDLTIRALYITHTLKGGMEERGQERSEHTRTHTHKYTLSTHLQRQLCTVVGHTVNKSIQALWTKRLEQTVLYMHTDAQCTQSR